MNSKRQEQINSAVEKFRSLLEGQLDRVDQINNAPAPIDYSAIDNIVIGICGGDGIGPMITQSAKRVLEFLLADEVRR